MSQDGQNNDRPYQDSNLGSLNLQSGALQIDLSVTFGAVHTLGTDRLTPTRGKKHGDVDL